MLMATLKPKPLKAISKSLEGMMSLLLLLLIIRIIPGIVSFPEFRVGQDFVSKVYLGHLVVDLVGCQVALVLVRVVNLG